MLACAALALVAIALAGCGEAADAGSAASASAHGQRARVVLHLDVGSYSLASPSATISGTVTPGSKVTVNHHRATVHGHRWHERLSLRLGENRVTVRATLAGRLPTHQTITLTREKSVAEEEAEARSKEAESREAESRERSTTQPAATPEETCTNGTYVNSAGNTVCRPEQSPSAPAGATAECVDGTYSFSESRSGTCSHHGGVARWLE